VTRRLKKSPNRWKCGPNCSQNIKNKIENTKHLLPTASEFKNKRNKPCFVTVHLCKNVKSAEVKSIEWQYLAQSGHGAHK
jgi:hypothetical protein